MGLKILGKRTLGQIGPHEFILLAFLAKIIADKIITANTDIWVNITGSAILMFYFSLTDRLSTLKTFIQGDITPLIKNEVVDELALKRHHVNREDLNHLARKYGYRNYEAFQDIFIEKWTPNRYFRSHEHG